MEALARARALRAEAQAARPSEAEIAARIEAARQDALQKNNAQSKRDRDIQNQLRQARAASEMRATSKEVADFDWGNKFPSGKDRQAKMEAVLKTWYGKQYLKKKYAVVGGGGGGLFACAGGSGGNGEKIALYWNNCGGGGGK